MKALGTLLFLLLAGPGLFWLGLHSLRTRAWQESVPALELLIDRALGEYPPPRTAWDRRFAHFQAWMNILLGAFFSFLGIAVIISLIIPE